MRNRDWQALRELLALRAQFQQFFEQALMPAAPPALASDASFEPPADVWEDAGHVVIEVDLPGARSSDFEVRLEGGDVLIAGSIAAPPERGADMLRIERPRGRFARRLRLPVPVDGTPRATLRGGVLTVTLRKAAAARRVPIEPGEDRP